ncbi:ABC transporter ATP-binding protein, partial [Cutibacterium acnes]
MVWGAHLVPHPQVQREQHRVDHVVEVHDITVTINRRTILSKLRIQ